MGFKAMSKEAPAATRNRNTDPMVVKLAKDLVDGKIKSIGCTGDDKLTGKKREQSCRAEASKVAHYITTKFGVKARTVWVSDESTVYVALVTDDNGAQVKVPATASA